MAYILCAFHVFTTEMKDDQSNNYLFLKAK